MPFSEIMYRARTNNLQLNDRERHKGKDVKCNMCGEEVEDLKHFILWCPAYDEERGKDTNFQRPYKRNVEELLGELLFENGLKYSTKHTLYAFWKIREEKEGAER